MAYTTNSAPMPDVLIPSTSAQRGSITVFPKPQTPDPFVNAGLTSLGPDANGVERFWISCVNTLMGAMSFLITENGTFSTCHWPVEKGFRSIYSVAQEDPDTLWLTGGATPFLIRLTLSSGRYEVFPRQAGRFVTAGMALDPDTGKLFCGAQTALLSFDTRHKKTVRIYADDKKPPDNFHYDHWRLPDGSYGFILETPGLSFLRWDPKTEDISWCRLTDDPSHPAIGLVRKLKYVENGRLYVPHFGWLDGITGNIAPHVCPPHEEACWLGRLQDRVIGIQYDPQNVASRFIAWHQTTGQIQTLFTVSDTPIMNCALTQSGKAVLVDVYGCFRRYNLETGALELTRNIESLRAHLCNVILPAGQNRVVGAPFIAQNFWTFDTKTNSGFYAGRAAGSLGQIDHAVNVDGKIYLVAYGGGQLTIYDPDKPHGYPRNPRLVAQNEQGQHGAGITTDGRVIWVAFKPKYGSLNGAMIRYDTTTGEATYRNGALPDQHLINPIYDPNTRSLVAGSSYLSDCESATPCHDRAFAVVLDPATLAVTKKAEGPVGADTLLNHGPINTRLWLMACGNHLYAFDIQTASLSICEQYPVLPEGIEKVAYTGTPGHYLVQSNRELQVWNIERRTRTPIATLADGQIKRWWVHGADLTFDCGQYAAIWCNALNF